MRLAVALTALVLVAHGLAAQVSRSPDVPPNKAFSVEVDLGGSWTAISANKSVSVPSTVPGDIFGDLMRAKVIGDPYWRYNDLEYRWVSLDNWTFTRTFELPSDMFSMNEVVLVCEGLQTVATILINGKRVGFSDNMFHRLTFPVKNVLAEGTNTITVVFQSTPSYAVTQKDKYPYDVPLNPEHLAYRGEPYRNYLRTSQASFGWDWGPCFLPQGIYRPIRLVGFVGYRIADVFLSQSSSSGERTVLADVSIVAVSPRSISLTLSVGAFSATRKTELVAGENRVRVTVATRDLPLWYPRGYGAQTMHDVALTAEDTDGHVETTKRRTGLRTVELVTDSVSTGSLFYFKVNGVPIYGKGANVIPFDAFPSRVTPDSIRGILQSAADANMNMLRLWGGGIFEQDAFYDQCDEMGLLVWEEFKFACALVPRDDAFLTSVSKEIRDQMTRLSHHPSVFLWSGNNENECTLSWTVGALGNRDLYVVDYAKVYVDTMVPLVASLDASRPFWPSSPSNGFLTTSPHVMRWGNPQNQSMGDVHFYNYNGMCTDVSIYPRPRFASEFGFQSYPDMTAWRRVSVADDWSVASPLMSHRQHHPNGNTELVNQVKMHFPYTDQTPFASFVWLTETMQALCMKTETEHYRRLKGAPERTMGTLYWQLNDIWEGPSWSSLEYGGRWKPLQYAMRRAYAPLLVSPYDQNGKLSVWVVSDDMKAFTGTMVLDLIPFASGASVYHTAALVRIPSLGSAEVFTEPVDTLLSRALKSCPKRWDCFVRTTLTDPSGVVLTDNVHFLAPFHNAPLARPSFETSVGAVEAGRMCTVAVRSSAVAVFTTVTADAVPGRFSDSLLTLLPGEWVQLTFYGARDFTRAELVNTLTVSSLYDMSH